MNWDRIEGNWKQVTGKVKEQWGKLTEDDLKVIGGKQDQLVAASRALRHRQGRGGASGEHLDDPHVRFTGNQHGIPRVARFFITEDDRWDARRCCGSWGAHPVLLMWALGWLH
jgi:hypothetical protein